MLRVRTRYFGRVRELLGVKAEEYEVEDGSTVADLLLAYIPKRHVEESEAWRRTVFRTAKGRLLTNRDGTPILRNHLILVDGKTSSLNRRLRDGDEVAVLPPFGGGCRQESPREETASNSYRAVKLHPHNWDAAHYE